MCDTGGDWDDRRVVRCTWDARGDCGVGCPFSGAHLRPYLQLWRPSCERDGTAAQTWRTIALRVRRSGFMADWCNLGVSGRVSLGRVHNWLRAYLGGLARRLVEHLYSADDLDLLSRGAHCFVLARRHALYSLPLSHRVVRLGTPCQTTRFSTKVSAEAYELLCPMPSGPEARNENCPSVSSYARHAHRRIRR